MKTVLLLVSMQSASQRQFFDIFRPPKPMNNFQPNGLTFPTDDIYLRPTAATTRRTTTQISSTTEYPTTRRTTTMTPCERQCLVTQEFNPVCATDGENYSNPGRLKCAQNCGKRMINFFNVIFLLIILLGVGLNHYGQCRSARTTQAPIPRFFNWRRERI